MCLILVALQVHPNYPLVIAANRDEYFDRPTQAATFWPDAPDLLAGRDLGAGGTWMGVTRQGRIAALTNVRNPARPEPEEVLSRGRLVSDYLHTDVPADDYLRQRLADGHRYNGFNLLCGTREALWYGSNCRPGTQKLPPGIHGLSNAYLDTPWPKVLEGKKTLGECLVKPDFQPEDLLAILNHRQRAQDDDLPNTGVGLEAERMLSSRFIEGQVVGYGTRASTALTMDVNGLVTLIEQGWDERGKPGSHKRFEMKL